MLAICDAALFHDLEGADEIKGLLIEGYQALQRELDLRQSILEVAQNRLALLGEEPSSCV